MSGKDSIRLYANSNDRMVEGRDIYVETKNLYEIQQGARQSIFRLTDLNFQQVRDILASIEKRSITVADDGIVIHALP